MNTGFQRSSTTSLGSRTSTTPVGLATAGKPQPAKNLPFIMAMHNVEYLATASPSHMKDFVEKVEKALAASKRGFAYLHIFSPCPTGWVHPSDEGIEIARLAVKSNFFPLYEVDQGRWKQTVSSASPAPVADYIQRLKKYSHISAEEVSALQGQVDRRMDTIHRMTAA
jgi:pyruvate/2-oxoacid:ferredoxin oxidoreductase beta subunit